MALNYPVTVPYTISGTSTSVGHDGVNGVVTITSGTVGTISIALTSDTVAGEESLIITMGTPANATIGATDKHTITIVDTTPTPPPTPLPTPDTDNQSSDSSGSSTVPVYLLLLSILLIGIRRKTTR